MGRLVRRRWPALAAGVAAVLAAAGPRAAAASSPAVGVPRPALRAIHAVADPVAGGRLVDSLGREVILRGVNDNALGDYHRNNRFPPTFPFRARDPRIMRRIGWNVVRLVVSWSRVEPSPGRYDDRYLDRVADVVGRLARERIYTVVDMHQDAWGPSVVAAAGTTCPPPTKPNLGWDGAPSWATLGSGAPHCYTVQREDSPAVAGSWQALFADAPGPGGVGLQTRFASMWGHVAARFARSNAVVGFDLLNEPEAGGPPDDARLAQLYGRVYSAIRAAERAHHGHRHLVMVEPSIVFSESGVDTPVPFPNDGDIAYAPHIYTGTFPTKSPPDERWFASARAEATLLGGAPVVNGEWGGRPRSRDPIDTSFYDAYQALQDKYGYSGAYWVFKSSCGDPFEIDQHATHAGGLYDVDCATNRIVGIRPTLEHVLARPYPRAVAGTAATFSFDPATRTFRLHYRPTSVTAATDVAVPSVQYGGRYVVAVTGGEVVSAAGSDILQIRACPSAADVSVVVRPGRGGHSHCSRVRAVEAAGGAPTGGPVGGSLAGTGGSTRLPVAALLLVVLGLAILRRYAVPLSRRPRPLVAADGRSVGRPARPTGRTGPSAR